MRTSLLILFFLTGIFTSGIAEIPREDYPDNLIPNPGFESRKRCPKGLGQIDLVDEWHSPNGGTPDYFNVCYTRDVQTVGIPNNYFSNQPLIEGEAYAGIYAGEKEREYLQVRLLEPLEPGTQYCLRFFASPPSQKGNQFKALKVWFGEQPISLSDWGKIDDEGVAQAPDYSPSGRVADWTLMTYSFEASGGEEYLTVGYFGETTGKGYTYLDNFGLFEYDSPRGCKANYFSGNAIQDDHNYVPNPSFEMKYACPDLREEMNKCLGWRVMENTPDYFHRCGRGTAAVPNNELGSQEPHTGEAYSGFWCYLPKHNDYREFISMELLYPLKKGEVYCLSMWVRNNFV